MSAFCLGLTRQQITDFAIKLIMKNLSSNSLFPRITAKVEPSTAMTIFYCLKFFKSKSSWSYLIFRSTSIFFLYELLLDFPWELISLALVVSIFLSDFRLRSPEEGDSITVKVSISIMRHDFAISIAVSSLSPVSIQKRISALISVAIVSGTPYIN